MLNTRRLKLILGCYWLGLFGIMHTPKGPFPAPLLFPHQDKVVHFFGYAILAGLTAAAAAWPTGGKWYGRWLLIFAAYAAFDELTQPLVGRHADVLDWAADIAGVALVFIPASRLSRRRGAHG